jgi:MFS transporter, PHS family, inorganic phosphate transporter
LNVGVPLREATTPSLRNGETQSWDLLNQLDEAPTSREHWRIMFISGMGFVTDVYDLFVIGIAATLITSEWHIASTQKSLLTSLVLLTSAAGAIALGRIADRLGRKKIYGYFLPPARL